MANVMQQLSDEELLQRSSNDDLLAYNVLFDRYLAVLLLACWFDQRLYVPFLNVMKKDKDDQ